MTEVTVSSTKKSHALMAPPHGSSGDPVRGWRVAAILATLLLVSTMSQVDRMLPFILAEAIKAELLLSDTQVGLINGIAFALCYALLSLPLARAADRGSPARVLALCILGWSAMTALGGLATSFLFLALTRFGVAFGEAGANPAGHAIIARKLGPKSRGLAIGLFAMGTPLGTMLGFAAGGAVSDMLGWRVTLIGAGVIGVPIMLMALVVVGATPPHILPNETRSSFWRTSLFLLSSPGFRWVFIVAILGSFAAAPFYAFTAPFLMRSHGLSTSEAGLAFGLLQGLTGVAGMLLGGRLFDAAVGMGARRMLRQPGIAFLIASASMSAALFVPVSWLSILLLVPSMFAFAFMMPWGFGAAHLLAGRGNEAMATSLVMIGSGLLGPAFGPLLVGVLSDAATAMKFENGIALGLLTVPVASLLTGLALFVGDRRVVSALRRY
ncbi:MFS transporter [Salipiger abyssi]|uniref:Arabinose efflux permease family protein n=1 Tax=Salipiger abyssi TaxID=1250539 RepID=A0A1P8US81_9RHOB|nr:MFS transporter [Salipiger abyssi]APZ52265.1 arabinose efflux permease family protein [Salipiger abyssi]